MPTPRHDNEDDPPVEAVQEYQVEFRIAKRRRLKAPHPARQTLPEPPSWVRRLGQVLWWMVETVSKC